MDITPFIQTAFGAIVGGSVVIATNWLTARREKTKSIQQWYEQTYVTEGVDCLISYFTGLQFLAINHTSLTLRSMELPKRSVPVEALSRIHTLLGIEIVEVIISCVHGCLSDTDDKSTVALDFAIETRILLYKLREELLKRISVVVTQKNQQIDFSNICSSLINIYLRLGPKYYGISDEEFLQSFSEDRYKTYYVGYRTRG